MCHLEEGYSAVTGCRWTTGGRESEKTAKGSWGMFQTGTWATWAHRGACRNHPECTTRKATLGHLPHRGYRQLDDNRPSHAKLCPFSSNLPANQKPNAERGRKQKSEVTHSTPPLHGPWVMTGCKLPHSTGCKVWSRLFIPLSLTIPIWLILIVKMMSCQRGREGDSTGLKSRIKGR